MAFFKTDTKGEIMSEEFKSGINDERQRIRLKIYEWMYDPVWNEDGNPFIMDTLEEFLRLVESDEV
jgi:hypothetical protein